MNEAEEIEKMKNLLSKLYRIIIEGDNDDLTDKEMKEWEGMIDGDICDICKERIESKQYMLVGGYKIHPECGEDAIGEYIYEHEDGVVECENCKAEIPKRHRFCRYCGHEQENYGG